MTQVSSLLLQLPLSWVQESTVKVKGIRVTCHGPSSPQAPAILPWGPVYYSQQHLPERTTFSQSTNIHLFPLWPALHWASSGVQPKKGRTQPQALWGSLVCWEPGIQTVVGKGAASQVAARKGSPTWKGVITTASLPVLAKPLGADGAWGWK